MSSGGASGGNTTTQTSGPPPEVLKNYQSLVGATTGVASQPLNLYGGPMVAGFTPQQQSAFSTIDNSQGIGTPFINAGAQEFGAATTPLWQGLPHFDTSGLPDTGTSGIANAQAEGQDIQGFARDVPNQIVGMARPSQNYATSAALYGQQAPSAIQPYAGFGNNQAQTVAGTAAGIPGSISPYAAMGTNYNVNSYLSPYTHSVTDALQNLFNEQNAEQFQQIRGNAAGQNAYGGDREAVAEAITARQQQLGEAPALSNALQQGFQQAQNESNTQQGLGLQAGQLTLGGQNAAVQGGLGAGNLGLGAGQLTLGGYNTAGQLNLGAAGANTAAGQLALGGYNTAIQGGIGGAQLGLGAGQAGFGEFNTQQQQKLAADQANAWLASQAGFGLSSLGNEAQQQALTGAQAQLGAGGLQQQLAQSNLNIPYQQFLAEQAYPYQSIGFAAPIIEGTGSLSGGTGKTTSPGPSPFSQIAGLGTAAAGLAPLFGGGSSSSDSGGGFFGGGSDAGVSSVDSGGGFFGGGGDTFAKRGGRTPGFAFGGGIPHVPEVDISYVSPPAMAPGGGELSPFQMDKTTTTTGGGSSGGGIGDAVGALGSVAKIGSFFLGLKDGGRPHYDGGGGIGSSSTLPDVPPINLDYIVGKGPQIKGSGPPKAPNPPQNQDSGFGEKQGQQLADAAKKIGSSGLLGGDSGDAPAGYAYGGAAQGVPLGAAISYGGAPPNLTQSYEQLAELPLERLREMAVQFPPNSQQGQLVARAIAQKQATPGSGTSPTGPVQNPMSMASPGQGMGGQPPLPGMAAGTAAAPLGGQDYGGTSHAMASGGTPNDTRGYVTHDELDPHPIVDHSGDTVKVRYPSEGRVLDLGLPAIQDESHYAAGGSVGASVPNTVPATNQGVYSTTVEAPNGTLIPQLNTRANPQGNIFDSPSTRFGAPSPGGGLGDWFQPMPQYVPPGGGPNGPGGTLTFPSFQGYTPGLGSFISAFGGTPGPFAGGSVPSTSTSSSGTASSDPSAEGRIIPIDQSVNASPDNGGGGKRGGRMGHFDEGGDVDDIGGGDPAAGAAAERAAASDRIDRLLGKYDSTPAKDEGPDVGFGEPKGQQPRGLFGVNPKAHPTPDYNEGFQQAPTVMPGSPEETPKLARPGDRHTPVNPRHIAETPRGNADVDTSGIGAAEFEPVKPEYQPAGFEENQRVDLPSVNFGGIGQKLYAMANPGPDLPPDTARHESDVSGFVAPPPERPITYASGIGDYSSAPPIPEAPEIPPVAAGFGHGDLVPKRQQLYPVPTTPNAQTEAWRQPPDASPAAKAAGSGIGSIDRPVDLFGSESRVARALDRPELERGEPTIPTVEQATAPLPVQKVSASIPTGIAPAQAAPAQAAPAQSEAKSDIYAVGDSHAGGLIHAGMKGTMGRTAATLNADAANGRTPRQVLDFIRSRPDGYWRGKDVYLSTGASNDPTQIDMVPAQIKALQDGGAHVLGLVGVGPKGASGTDMAPYAAKLDGFAQEAHIEPGGMFQRNVETTGPQPGVHLTPQGYKEVAQSQGAGQLPPPDRLLPAGRGSQATPGSTPSAQEQIAPWRQNTSVGRANVQTAIGTLRDEAHLSDAAIKGIMANGLSEGGFNSTWQKAWGAENSFGHWQLNRNGELPAYQAFLQKTGMPNNTRSQALFVAQRMEEIHPGFSKIQDPKQATDLVATQFEKYQGAAPGQRYGRLADAEKLMAGDFSVNLGPAGHSGGATSGAPPGATLAGGGTYGPHGNPNAPDIDSPAGHQQIAATSQAMLAHTPPEHRNAVAEWMKSPSYLLFLVGAGMLSSKSPFPGVALGEGLKLAAEGAGKAVDLSNKSELAQVRLSGAQEKINNDKATLQFKYDNLDRLAKAGEATLAQRTEKDQLAAQLRLLQIAQANAEHDRKAQADKDKDDRERQRINQQNWRTVVGDNGNYYKTDPKDPTNMIDTGVKAQPKYTGERGILHDFMDSGMDVSEATRTYSEMKRDPRTAQNSQAYAGLVQREAKRIQDSMSGMNMSPNQVETLARRNVQANLELGGAPAAPASTPATPPAPQPSAPVRPAWAAADGVSFKGQPIYPTKDGWHFVNPDGSAGALAQ